MPNFANLRKIATTWCVFLQLFVWIEVLFRQDSFNTLPQTKIPQEQFPSHSICKVQNMFFGTTWCVFLQLFVWIEVIFHKLDTRQKCLLGGFCALNNIKAVHGAKCLVQCDVNAISLQSFGV